IAVNGATTRACVAATPEPTTPEVEALGRDRVTSETASAAAETTTAATSRGTIHLRCVDAGAAAMVPPRGTGRRSRVGVRSASGRAPTCALGKPQSGEQRTHCTGDLEVLAHLDDERAHAGGRGADLGVGQRRLVSRVVDRDAA